MKKKEDYIQERHARAEQATVFFLICAWFSFSSCPFPPIALSIWWPIFFPLRNVTVGKRRLCGRVSAESSNRARSAGGGFVSSDTTLIKLREIITDNNGRVDESVVAGLVHQNYPGTRVPIASVRGDAAAIGQDERKKGPKLTMCSMCCAM